MVVQRRANIGSTSLFRVSLPHSFKTQGKLPENVDKRLAECWSGVSDISRICPAAEIIRILVLTATPSWECYQFIMTATKKDGKQYPCITNESINLQNVILFTCGVVLFIQSYF